ncbi:GNAT family N-acetyltransferase [Anaeromicropila herbilytica]|uniref:Acetyltransferase n=1 Tax=Anaeromicropila herbilytica TaxID=2785025 RepID=A0A7R7IE22_9FIRM|nr:GNAT family N-acetyltransferase [Anaeromicropila herbilytica]BCN30623.1 acetyltransferase [Anaeromicropila herbilytica]
MVKVNQNQMVNIAPLFEGWEETMIWSCLDGCMGQAWADQIEHPSIALIIVSDFGFLAGDVDSVEASVVASYIPDYYERLILVPKDAECGKLIQKVYASRSDRSITSFQRYALKKEKDAFNREHLQSYVDALPKEYQILPIDKEIFQVIKCEDWSYDLVSAFSSFEDYLEKAAVGYVVIKDSKIVSGVSTYTYYKGGVEIEIDTHPEYRRRGLGIACAARFILECISRDLYPSWDAANKGSLDLAIKLGYHFDKEYTAYFIQKCSE